MKTLHRLVILGAVIACSGISLIFILNSISYCNNLRVEHVSDHDLDVIRNNTMPQPVEFLQVTDEDLKAMPKLKQLINAVNDRVEFNTYGRIILSPSEVQTYYKFLGDKFEKQNGFKTENNSFLHINYNGKKYLIDGFIISTSNYPLELSATLDSSNVPEALNLSDDDFGKIPGIKKAINEIGTYETSTFIDIGIPKDELNKYQAWFKEKYEKQYGTKLLGDYSTYFHYDVKNYFVGFYPMC